MKLQNTDLCVFLRLPDQSTGYLDTTTTVYYWISTGIRDRKFLFWKNSAFVVQDFDSKLQVFCCAFIVIVVVQELEIYNICDSKS